MTEQSFISKWDFSKPLVLFVTDVYCGWCWGFSENLSKFEAENIGKVAFAAISGGLFVPPRSGALKDYPHIPHANARINEMTGAQFGKPYDDLLKDGTFVMDSEAAAANLAALRSQDPSRGIRFAKAMQAAFYLQGKSLSDPTTALEIAQTEGLDVDRVAQLIEDGTAGQWAQDDFAFARQIGANSYPTLVLIKDQTAYPLPATGATLAEMTSQLDTLLT